MFIKIPIQEITRLWLNSQQVQEVMIRHLNVRTKWHYYIYIYKYTYMLFFVCFFVCFSRYSFHLRKKYGNRGYNCRHVTCKTPWEWFSSINRHNQSYYRLVEVFCKTRSQCITIIPSEIYMSPRPSPAVVDKILTIKVIKCLNNSVPQVDIISWP